VQAIELAETAGLDAGSLRPAATAALHESGMRAFAIGAYPSAVRALRAAARWSLDGLDPRALRVLGKALVFTEQSGGDELRLAFDGLVAAGARGEAAVAAIDIGYSCWQHGDGASTAEWVARGLELVEDEPPSFEHAHVVAQAARFTMLSGRSAESLVTADRALELSAACGAHPPRTSALITKATARTNLGDFGSFREDFDQALSFAQEHDLTEVGRAYFNLGSILLDLGDLEEALSTARLGLAVYARLGVELAHARVDDQVVVPIVAAAAWMLARAGEKDARLLADELLERRQRNLGGLLPGVWTVHAALALDRLGRGSELAALGERPGSRFLEAALAIDSGRYVDAAATLAAVGAPQLEAEVQVLAARERRAEGDERGAEERLARARELLAGLGATARLRELDASDA
jgi:tetratricopeptide (TPR) repeat protein